MSKKKISAAVLTVIIIFGIAAALVFAINSESTAREITKEEAEELVNTKLDALAATKALKEIAGKNKITVTEITYGDKKDIILDCTVNTVDAYSAISPYYNVFMSADVKKASGTMFKSALDFKLEFEDKILELLESAADKTADCEISIYDTKDGLILYRTDEVINTVYGGTVDIANDINEKKTAITTDENGNETEITLDSSNLKKGFIQCIGIDPMKDEPDTATALVKTWNSLKYDFNRNFIEKERWKTIITGLWVTIRLTVLALLLGIIIGFIVAFIRCTYIKTAKHGIVLKILNGISGAYLSVIRGTPVVVQIMIIYFVIFLPIGFTNKFFASVICFGLNSGAYVAEIVRGGIMSIDNGQMEAGRSLGFNYLKTMYYIVFPQAFKAVLPSLANEFVVLLKETSVAFYIGLGDLMYAGNAIRAATYSAFMPLVTVAIIYFVMVLVLSKLVGLLERRLRNNER